jgi:hypothetical protein
VRDLRRDPTALAAFQADQATGCSVVRCAFRSRNGASHVMLTDALVTYNTRHFATAAIRFGLRIVRPVELLEEMTRWARRPIRLNCRPRPRQRRGGVHRVLLTKPSEPTFSAHGSSIIPASPILPLMPTPSLA